MNRFIFILFIFIGLSYLGLNGAEPQPPQGPTGNQVSPQEEKKINDLVKQLGADDWREREAAQTELLKIGMPARAFLEKALKETNDPEIRLRARKLLEDIPDTMAKESFIQGMENLLKAKGFRIKGVLKVCQEDQEDNTPGQEYEDIYHKDPDFTCSKRIDGDNEEVSYYRKDHKVIVKDLQSGEWIEGSEESVIELVPRSSEVSKGDYIEKVHFIGEEKVKGVDCKIIQASLKADRFRELFGPVPKMPAFSDIRYQIYLGKEDNLIHKATCSMSRGYEENEDAGITQITEMDFSYNEVKLEIPEEVRKLLGMEKDASPKEK